NGNRADRLHGLIIEDWFEGAAAIQGLPHAAAGRASENDEASAIGVGSECGYASAHFGGANVASGQARDSARVKTYRRLLCDGHARDQEQARGPQKRFAQLLR